ncbi:MAG: PQQ-binding-like beta-propeller repeat protein [Verrucomicrobiales bacterium]|nr:PQQ-binding-like beta-propeller repeat protein [Verrucomicrobiales bacterium]
MKSQLLLIVVLWCGVCASPLRSADWPMWRHDAGRTAESKERFDVDKLELLWLRRLPVIKPAYRDARLQFDKGYEPVAADNRLFIGSNLDDSVTAFDATSGKQLWKFFTEGPVRFAPVVWEGKLLFGSDDGYLYCLSAEKGELLWKFRAVPSARKLTGNKRLISVWPVRGGPVVHEDKVYFAAGVLPFEGVFVYSLDAATGKVQWLNDSTGYIYGQQPHGTEALGGLAPQGYLLIDEQDLVVPSSNAYPARFDLKTGKLKEFKLPSAGRLPGGWFASTPAAKAQQKLKRRGVIFDNAVNRVRHEDKPETKGLPDIRTTITTSDHEWNFADGLPNVKGEIHTMLAADGKLFVVTLEGGLYAFAEKKEGEPKAKGVVKFITKVKRRSIEPTSRASLLLNKVRNKHGLVVVMGGADEALLEGLIENNNFSLLVLEGDAKRADKLRRYLNDRGLYGRWVVVKNIKPKELELPPYVADLIIVGEKLSVEPEQLTQWYDYLRPYGGVMLGAEALIDVAEASSLPRAQFEGAEGLTVITRQGPLEGATNYTGNWEKSADMRVKAPLGTLWFDDGLGLFKRSPQPKIVDGVMISIDKNWHDVSARTGSQDYRLLPPKFSNVYTGRVLEIDEALSQRQSFSAVDFKQVQPLQYRPPSPKKENEYKPERVRQVGERLNLLTGEKEARSFTKQYGCDGGFDYGNLYTMRSATPAFYDKTIESGPINLSGPRSGCTNSVIPAAGVLNVPYFYEGCSCAYPLPIGLSLVSQPQTYEQWTAWGAVAKEKTAGKIQRLGINLGAPGDRVTHDGTLWVDFPSVGGPSPEVEVETQPAGAKAFYHHSLWIEGGKGWPWVAASGMQGLQSFSVKGIKPGEYAVRLVFLEPDDKKVGERVFAVFLQGKPWLKDLDVVQQAGGRMRALTQVSNKVVVAEDGRLLVELKADKGATILSGVELIRIGLKADEPLLLQDKATQVLWSAKDK